LKVKRHDLRVTDLDFLEYVYKSQLSKDYLPQSAEKLPGRERKQLITLKKKRGGGGVEKKRKFREVTMQSGGPPWLSGSFLKPPVHHHIYFKKKAHIIKQ
jgi:hypothetical protein